MGQNNVDWLTVSPLQGSGDTTLSITAAVNTGSSRNCVVTVKNTQYGITRTINVLQEAGYYIDISSDSVSFNATGGTQTITITSNISWEIFNDFSWLTVTPQQGSLDGIINLSVSSFSNIRACHFTISNETYGITKTIMILQGSEFDKTIIYSTEFRSLLKPNHSPNVVGDFGSGVYEVSNSYYGSYGTLVFNTTVEKIGYNLFSTSTSSGSSDDGYHSGQFLTKIIIPSEVTTIEGAVFNNDTRLTEVRLNNNLKSIGALSGTNLSSAFRRTGLSSINLPDKLTLIGEKSFQTTNITDLVIPKNVQVEALAFADSYRLTSVTINGPLTLYPSVRGGSIFSGCTNLSTVIFNGENNYQSIPGSAFKGCSSLKNIIFNISRISIYNEAFMETGIEEITLPVNTESIGNNAFKDCEYLTSFTCLSLTPPTIGTTILYGTTCTIYVPASAVDTYKSATGWSAYATRIQAIP